MLGVGYSITKGIGDTGPPLKQRHFPLKKWAQSWLWKYFCSSYIKCTEMKRTENITTMTLWADILLTFTLGTWAQTAKLSQQHYLIRTLEAFLQPKLMEFMLSKKVFWILVSMYKMACLYPSEWRMYILANSKASLSSLNIWESTINSDKCRNACVCAFLSIIQTVSKSSSTNLRQNKNSLKSFK